MVFKHVYPIVAKAKFRPFYHKTPASERVVIILGWAGSEPKHYKKLISYYESKNTSVLLQIMPPLSLQIVRSHYEEEIAKLFESHEIRRKNVHVHCFSNNGSWVFAGLLKRGLLHNARSIRSLGIFQPIDAKADG